MEVSRVETCTRIWVHLLGHSCVHRLLGQLVQLAHGTEVAPEQFHRLRTDQSGKIQQPHLLGHLLLRLTVRDIRHLYGQLADERAYDLGSAYRHGGIDTY